jgi:hypothetical protein
MLARTICFLFAIAFVPLPGIARDVVYRLDANALKPRDESKVLNLSAIEFQDRIWAAPGIEQATIELDPPKKCDFNSPERIRIVHAWDPASGPEWLDDAALPRTRQMYGLGQSSNYSCWDSTQSFSDGEIVFQR